MTHTLAGLADGRPRALRCQPAGWPSKCVMLTDKGRRFREDAIARLKPDFAQLSRHFKPETIAGALPLLAELRAYLDKAREE